MTTNAHSEWAPLQNIKWIIYSFRVLEMKWTEDPAHLRPPLSFYCWTASKSWLNIRICHLIFTTLWNELWILTNWFAMKSHPFQSSIFLDAVLSFTINICSGGFMLNQMFIWRHGEKSTESNKNIYKIMLHSPCIGIYFDWIQWSSRTDFSLHPSKSSLSLLCHTFYSALEYAGSPNFPFSIDTIDSKKRIPHRYMANLSLEISDIPMCTDTRYRVYFELLTISNIRWDSFESTCL